MKAEKKAILENESIMILVINTPFEETSKVFFLSRFLKLENMKDYFSFNFHPYSKSSILTATIY